jgi:AhpD family alkylhydroperoxidase
MMAAHYFKKRTYTFRPFFRDIYRLMGKSTSIRKVMKSNLISNQFKEKIMLAVTAVNNCRYCEWGHTKMALEAGCSEEEIQQIMTHDFSSCDPDELIASRQSFE